VSAVATKVSDDSAIVNQRAEELSRLATQMTELIARFKV
jgi:methyl-accepting chemotaxis protein